MTPLNGDAVQRNLKNLEKIIKLEAQRIRKLQHIFMQQKIFYFFTKHNEKIAEMMHTCFFELVSDSCVTAIAAISKAWRNANPQICCGFI